MADNVPITAGSGTTVGTETKTINSVAVQVQEMTLALGARDVYAASSSGRDCTGSGDGALFVDARSPIVDIAQTPTITAALYASGNALGGLLTFANAARTSGKSILVASAVISDKAKQNSNIALVLYNQTFSATTDKTAMAPSNADMLNIRGVIYFGSYTTFNANSVASVPNVGMEILLTGTSLFGQLMVIGTPTYTSTSDITVALTIVQD